MASRGMAVQGGAARPIVDDIMSQARRYPSCSTRFARLHSQMAAGTAASSAFAGRGHRMSDEAAPEAPAAGPEPETVQPAVHAPSYHG